MAKKTTVEEALNDFIDSLIDNCKILKEDLSKAAGKKAVEEEDDEEDEAPKSKKKAKSKHDDDEDEDVEVEADDEDEDEDEPKSKKKSKHDDDEDEEEDDEPKKSKLKLEDVKKALRNFAKAEGAPAMNKLLKKITGDTSVDKVKEKYWQKIIDACED